jgi:threonine dehydrogenase-like Zn-dependent dehydrogenase
MHAIAIKPGVPGTVLVERKEPDLQNPDEIKIRIHEVGICGTDREEVKGGRADAPRDREDLVIGHEMFGQVVAVGEKVSRVKKGDFAVFTVRRGCGRCLPCQMNRPDMCLTGDYKERGIKGLDGYQAEYVVDKEQYVVCVPPELKKVGVLCEPLSVAEKAIDEVQRIQNARLPDAPSRPDWLHGRRCLVAGMGPIGLLAALALRLRGAEVYGLDIVDRDTPRPQWLDFIGGKYMDGRNVSADKLDHQIGPMELIFESTGVASLEFNLLDALGTDGIYVLTGIPGGDRPLEIPGAELVRQLVLDNQVMVGSVNAARDHFQMAVDDLLLSYQRWNRHIEKLISNRYSYDDFESAFSNHPTNEIKTVIHWQK